MNMNDWLLPPLDTMDRITLGFKHVGKIDNDNITHGRKIYAQELQVSESSYPSCPAARPALVPMEAPWVDGQRYREAGATEITTRFFCYLEDVGGPWIRRHGVLLAAT